MDQNPDHTGLTRRRLLARTGTLATLAVSGVRLADSASAATGATGAAGATAAGTVGTAGTTTAATGAGTASAAAVPPVVAYGLDYAWAPHPSTSAMLSAGYTFAIRYLSNDPTKNLTLAEAQALNAAGIPVVCNWEAATTAALNGYNQGVSDATSAQQQAAACGMPPDRPIYFSLDWDVQSGDMTAVNAYFDGVASVIGAARAGAYSSYDALGWLLGSGRIQWAWQSESTSYSGGRNASPYPGIQLWQTGEFTFDGADCDKNEAFTADFGQWPVRYDQGSGGLLATGVHKDGRIEVFAVTPGGAGIQNRYETAPDQAWSGWNAFGPDTSGTKPKVVSVAAGRHLGGRVEVFAVMSDGSILNKYEQSPGGNWSGWNGFANGGTAASASVGAHQDGRLEIFAVTPGGSLLNMYETVPDGPWASTWSGFGPTGTTLKVESVTAARHAHGRLEVFVVMSDGSMQNKYEQSPDGTWSPWNGYADKATSVIGSGYPGTDSSGVHLDGRMEVFAVTSNGGLANKFEGSPDGTWSGWNGFGPTDIAPQTVVASAVSQHKSGRLEVFAVISDGSIKNRYEQSPNGSWSSWNGFANAGTVKA
ncbi:hypothetical protein ABH920_008612 [Catenulispora sp. EB89]|uniref:glycoside hydrolase domain-containing protein n=1 Tax=Catenulispora sp. EB89 TaxID=3156257 RepID=UPI003516850F